MDAADKSWHLTSPTPYDPPLTYGGWNQAKALGSRVATILEARVDSKNAESGAAGTVSGWRQRYKIVIHSSPFLRCVQTSIAIGAGISQHRSGKEKRERRVSSENRAALQAESAIDEDQDEQQTTSQNGRAAGAQHVNSDLKDHGVLKSALRIDAFLGEWLTPDYYENITSPPGSTMMVAGAKAEILRSETIDIFQHTSSVKGHFPGGWNRPGSSQLPPIVDDQALSPKVVSQSGPRTYRASTHSTHGADSGRNTFKSANEVYSTIEASKATYIAPVPAYSVSTSHPIPRGYVTHAKDACVDVDFQWDSMRAPQDWGDGGDFGEEWSAMHKRFRAGLFRLVTWYKDHGVQSSGAPAVPVSDTKKAEDDQELVVILVTHGAGCNALIGGFTNQPVLMDVGLASLTVAMRRESEDDWNTTSSAGNNNNFGVTPFRSMSNSQILSEAYEMKLVASLDHLRAGVDASKMTGLQSPNLVPKIPEYRRRNLAKTGSAGVASPSSPLSKEVRRPVNSSLGSIRRSATTSTSALNHDSWIIPNRSSSNPASLSASGPGLWSKNSSMLSSFDEAAEFSAYQMDELSLGPSLAESDMVQSPIDATESARDTIAPLPTDVPDRSFSQHGLWAPRVPEARQDAVSTAPKRRWTVNEQDG